MELNIISILLIAGLLAVVIPLMIVCLVCMYNLFKKFSEDRLSIMDEDYREEAIDTHRMAYYEIEENPEYCNLNKAIEFLENLVANRPGNPYISKAMWALMKDIYYDECYNAYCAHGNDSEEHRELIALKNAKQATYDVGKDLWK